MWEFSSQYDSLNLSLKLKKGDRFGNFIKTYGEVGVQILHIMSFSFFYKRRGVLSQCPTKLLI